MRLADRWIRNRKLGGFRKPRRSKSDRSDRVVEAIVTGWPLPSVPVSRQPRDRQRHRRRCERGLGWVRSGWIIRGRIPAAQSAVQRSLHRAAPHIGEDPKEDQRHDRAYAGQREQHAPSPAQPGKPAFSTMRHAIHAASTAPRWRKAGQAESVEQGSISRPMLSALPLSRPAASPFGQLLKATRP